MRNLYRIAAIMRQAGDSRENLEVFYIYAKDDIEACLGLIKFIASRGTDEYVCSYKLIKEEWATKLVIENGKVIK